jgi:ADP-ribosylation factor-like protein 2
LADAGSFFSKALGLPAIKSHQWSIIPCSAITGYNLLEGLNWVVGEVASRLYYSTFTESAAGPIPDKPLVVS